MVGFVEDDHDIAVQVAQELKLQRWDNLEALLASRLDIAIIEALDRDVPALVKACIGRVNGVLLEKPGAAQPPAAYELIKPLRAAQTVVEFGYEMHYADFMVSLHQALKSGCLGQVTLARLHGGNPVGCALELWQSLPDDLGGVGYTEGCHIVELAVDLFGPPASVSALTVKLPPGERFASPYYKPALFSTPGLVTEVQVGTCEHEDLVTATLVYPDKFVTIDLTAWEAGNWVQDWAVQIYGTNGTAEAAMGSELVTLTLREARGGYPAGTTTLKGGQTGLTYMYERQLKSLIDRTMGTEVPDEIGLEAGMDVLRVLEAIFGSAAAGGTSVPLRELP